MKKTIFISAFIIHHLSFMTCGSAQNLVPNPSFEEYIVCPNIDDITNTPPWYNPTGPYPITSPNVFNSCAPPWPSSNYGVPMNGWGFQTPRTGNGYAGGIIVYDEVLPYEREYISVKLDSPLIASNTYCICFYVSVCYFHSISNGYIGSRYATDRLGAYISDTAIHLNTDYIIPVVPQIENPTGNFLSDTLNWMLVSGTYVAQGGEQYITIGNFYADDSTNYIQISDTTNLSFSSFYYIDDVYVGRCDTSQPTNENYFSISNAFTPDADGMNDIFSPHGQNIKSLSGKIFNRWGMVLFEWSDVNSGWDGRYDGTYVSAGAYFYIINVNYYDGSNEEKKGTVQVIR